MSSDPPPKTQTPSGWEAVERVTALPEFWCQVAKHRGGSLVALWQLMTVCQASRMGVREHLSTLPGLVICGGKGDGRVRKEVWRLDLATLRWEPIPPLLARRYGHACCAVRGSLVVLGGEKLGWEMLPAGGNGARGSPAPSA